MLKYLMSGILVAGFFLIAPQPQQEVEARNWGRYRPHYNRYYRPYRNYYRSTPRYYNRGYSPYRNYYYRGYSRPGVGFYYSF